MTNFYALDRTVKYKRTIKFHKSLLARIIFKKKKKEKNSTLLSKIPGQCAEKKKKFCPTKTSTSGHHNTGV